MQNKLNEKYHVWIWIGLIVSALVRNIYSIYQDVASMIADNSRLSVLTGTLSIIFVDGVLPTLLCFVLALLLYYITARRHSNYMSRKDFCYWVMLFTAIPRFIVGIVECFAILSPAVAIVTSTLLDVLLLPASYIVMYFVVFVRLYKLNPVENYNLFSLLSTIVLVVLGLIVLGENLTIVSIGLDPEFAEELNEIMREYGYEISSVTSTVQVVSSSIAMCVFCGYLIADIVVVLKLKKDMRLFRDSDTREDYTQRHGGSNYGYSVRDDVDDTFDIGNDSSDNDDNVFDEFDI